MKHFVTLAALLTSLVALSQTPQLPFNPDENGDGLVGVADLQSFLALYNTEFAAAVTSNGIAFINLGMMNRTSCLTSCNSLPGRWGLASLREVSMNWQLVADVVGDWDPDVGGANNDSYRFWISTNNTDYPTLESPNYARFNQDAYDEWLIDSGSGNIDSGDYYRCVCSITERPKIEYQRIAQDGDDSYMNTIVNELLDEGWYIHSNDELYMHLWRWKD